MNTSITARFASVAFAILMTVGTLTSIDTLATHDGAADVAQMAQSASAPART